MTSLAQLVKVLRKGKFTLKQLCVALGESSKARVSVLLGQLDKRQALYMYQTPIGVIYEYRDPQ